MVGIERIEQLVKRERKIFKFLAFYLFLAIFLVLLYLNTGGWIFVETAMVVLLVEIFITGFVKRGMPLHKNKEVADELSKIEEIDEYTELREEYIENKNETIMIAMTVYLLGIVLSFLVMPPSYFYIFFSITGLLILYFSIYVFFRYKIDKITIILLERNKAIKEMKKSRLSKLKNKMRRKKSRKKKSSKSKKKSKKKTEKKSKKKSKKTSGKKNKKK